MKTRLAKLLLKRLDKVGENIDKDFVDQFKNFHSEETRFVNCTTTSSKLYRVKYITNENVDNMNKKIQEIIFNHRKEDEVCECGGSYKKTTVILLFDDGGVLDAVRCDKCLKVGSRCAGDNCIRCGYTNF